MNRDAYEDTQIVHRATQALRNAPVPPGPPADVLATVGALDGRVHRIQIPARRFPMKRVLSIAAGLLLLVGVAGVVYHLLGASATVAFAEVRRQIEQAQTMKWRIQMQITLPQQPGEIEVSCYYKEPGLMRQEAVMSKTGEKAINTISFEAGKILSLAPAQKQAVLVDMGQLPQKVRDKQVNFVAEMKKMVQGNGEELGFKEIDGQRLKGFRVTRNAQTMDIWVDPKTGTPVAMEMAITGIGAMKMDRFVLGEELDDALFSVVPPADYQVMNFNMPLGNPTEADLTAGLRYLAELNDNTFPDTLVPTGKMIEQLQGRDKENQAKYEGLSDQEKIQKALETTGPLVRMSMYAQLAKDFRYVGAGVKLGEAGRIVCRYKPPGSETYRVVYGDLHIEDAPAEPNVQPGAE